MVIKTIDSIRTSLTRIQSILLWLIALWFAYSLGINGVRKLDPDGFWTNAFQRWGYPNWFRTLIGVLELFGALLLLIPKIRYIGAFILFFVMIGALITRIIHGTSLGDALSIASNAIVFLYLITYHSKNDTPSITKS
ncbi:hypothetical protein D7030_04425 [Flavobacteriaceae bacterium AU392]|nr:hypothetical protein D1817_10900 [Flavobacteriaceae bacterium]RKM85923.1 hypothetical protein D7030_04425 [Flavobacteriaceae bacterium AU392]